MSRLDEIRERCENATPGPWETDVDNGLVYSVIGYPYYESLLYANREEFYAGFFEKADAEFVANAREDVPWLLDYIKQLTADLHELVTAYKDCFKCIHYDETTKCCTHSEYKITCDTTKNDMWVWKEQVSTINRGINNV